ncbi:HAD superfamily hydrolase (TIGR01509 family)/HAD superfamily hydrolase (TIGR01549 family) [Trichococcus patagoniensis]|uniref:HAD superfamily hydrolase (TIGR01509 family)/HAD superfamily hydrolase (TIGR01549 family) n=1 Tax=Trichococcus patagoniensis TaxID=382641 RepID=A0A2T5IIG0_9LACT|nr:HAD family hydrolase [Trichococcus patagoniensis]PTQ83613.1 HAD superfamily hydrolase (TIGR01509 family)/HAD superfamily hydrolase (TIGR01549 family) [Trichococcus patagoniensis]
MMKLEAAIFDLDGTLLDSMPIWEGLGQNYLLQKKVQPAPGLQDTLNTMSLQQAAQHFREAYGLREDEETIIWEIQTLIADLYRYEVPLKAGAAEYLQTLQEQNVKMCIATATERKLAESALERLGIREYFSTILTSSEVKAGKDNPLIYHRAVEHLGAPLTKTIIFEDALHAIETATSAGFRVVGVYDESAAQDRERIEALTEQYIYSFSDWKG